ncbi:MAG: hypothetical protein ACU0BN_07765 [Sulfitobacter sp.]
MMDFDLYMAIRGYQRVYSIDIDSPLLTALMAKDKFDGEPSDYVKKFNAGEMCSAWVKVGRPPFSSIFT